MCVDSARHILFVRCDGAVHKGTGHIHCCSQGQLRLCSTLVPLHCSTIVFVALSEAEAMVFAESPGIKYVYS